MMTQSNTQKTRTTEMPPRKMKKIILLTFLLNIYYAREGKYMFVSYIECNISQHADDV